MKKLKITLALRTVRWIDDRRELNILAKHTSIPLSGDKNLSLNASRHCFV
jgi:hypothetical protein